MGFGFSGVNHIALVTNDMETTVKFWRDLLGMRLVLCMGRKGYRQYFFEIDERNLLLFFEWPEVEQIPAKDHGVPVKGPFAFDHLSIGVRELKDLFQLKDTLEAAGFWVSEVVDHGFILSIYSFDPNEIPIEFSVHVPKNDVRKKPILKDKHPLKVTLEGPEPVEGRWPRPSAESPQEHRIYPGEGLDYFRG